jgi:hypothetical protein
VGKARLQATGRCKFTVGRIADASYNHSALGRFPNAGRLDEGRLSKDPERIVRSDDSDLSELVVS